MKHPGFPLTKPSQRRLFLQVGQTVPEPRRGRPQFASQPVDTMGGVTRAPVEVPPFTIGQLRKALPAHCFERSLLRSSAYLAADLAAAALLLAASQLIPAGWPGLALWPAYWFLQARSPAPQGPLRRGPAAHAQCSAPTRGVRQGAVLTGVWVVAHECGHGAFSPWQPVNDGVGLVLHSCLLVPYFSWCAAPPAAPARCQATLREIVQVKMRAAAQEALAPAPPLQHREHGAG